MEWGYSLSIMNLSPISFIILCAAAGGMGWGIRGQYGHGTGATVAALHVSLAIGLALWGRISNQRLIKAIALSALAGGIGGSMTYGQTLGLTQDSPLVGNWDAWKWGMLGIFIKGGVWIGLFGLFLGVGLSRWEKVTHTGELVVHAVLSLFILYLGVLLFNEPFDPDNRKLPWLYFSDHWKWEPDSDLSPRREKWGGLLLVLIYWLWFTSVEKKMKLPARMAGFGFVAGGVGFCTGQAIQSFHAWNPEFGGQWNSYINWWNMMETGFGCVWGAIIGFGIFRSLHLIIPANQEDDSQDHGEHPPCISIATEWIALIVMSGAILIWNLGSFQLFDYFADIGWSMLIIPMAGILGGKIWPTAYIHVVTFLPIIGKTIREMSFRHEVIPPWLSFVLLGFIPLALGLIASWKWIQVMNPTTSHQNINHLEPGKWFLISACGIVWINHLLNFCFFRFPWPWEPWTARTPNEIIFFIGAVIFTCFGVRAMKNSGWVRSN